MYHCNILKLFYLQLCLVWLVFVLFSLWGCFFLVGGGGCKEWVGGRDSMCFIVLANFDQFSESSLFLKRK